MPGVIKAAIYSRISSTEQNVENQLFVLKEWAKQRGFDVVSVYSEEESAWRRGHQRELGKLLRESRRRDFEVVLVWALDRLSRQGALSILSLIHELARHGVHVLSRQESWTDTTPQLAEVLYAIAGWTARQESQRISERTKAGLARAVSQGKRLGRPPGARDKRRRKKRSPKMAAWADMELYPGAGG